MRPTGRAGPASPEPCWVPPPDAGRRTTIGRFAAEVHRRLGVDVSSYHDLLAWSLADVDAFWSEVWTYFDVQADGDRVPVREGPDMAGTRWFPHTRLNWAEHALSERFDGAAPAVVALSQSRGPVTLTRDELRREVARVAGGLAALGVGRGDRVVGYLPNVPEAVVALLAAASLGAVWSSCAPEFGTPSVVDRFGQIEPRVLVAVDGYRYGDRVVDRRAEVDRLRAALPTLAATVVVRYLEPDRHPQAGCVAWEDLGPRASDAGTGSAAGAGTAGEPRREDAGAAGPTDLALRFERVPFDHPLYVLYSSGTTGKPKAIVHGHGGILLTHLRDLALQLDLGPADRFFWFTTTGWMMWNFLVSGLVTGSAIVLFDGDPGHPDLLALWRVAAETGVTAFGVSAPFLMACRRAGIEPRRRLDLGAVRLVGSTGAPLPAAGFEWVAASAVPGVPVASISGGTDVCSILVAHAPTVPVWPGEISCRVLATAAEAFDPAGRPVVGVEGELVVTAPLPSMPVGLWGDADGTRYRDTYFSRFPGVWCHGDWVTFTERGSCVIHGRSDATLNRSGVRMGTAELYAVVEGLDEVADSLVVHLEDPEGGPGELVLFVVPAPGVSVDEELEAHLAAAIRRALSPRHVPDRVVAVTDVPRTLSGKKVEVPVKRILAGADAGSVVGMGALANPGALEEYVELARAWRAAARP